ncbi:arginine--tRNA ligase [Thalassobacillus pellis]|uniref:arginine--tRNA ligase n=1 Tax=Thalassobacillus pellis TaxID=748008 RepID=UPI00195FE899|nr:arginine--tRNA ligase [Thalassobacillus pellis]MBM7553124.1 arginyl-tRNA synthetase [Thalassobacillus pellis]
MDYQMEFAALLEKELHEHSQQDISKMIEKPRYDQQGDLAFPCFTLAKIYRKSPAAIAEGLAGRIQSSHFVKAEAVNGYINVFINKTEAAANVIAAILREGGEYGKSDIAKGSVITIDLSSPNIAKPFSMGHLRSTVIGNSLSLIAEKCGYRTVKINHIGDWGTQFGKLIVAYKKWGEEEKVRANPIKELLNLYVRFHKEAEIHPELNDEGREWFKKLENGEEEALELWHWFKEESLKEFAKVYELLGISFNSNHGEAFYNDKMEQVADELKEKGLLQESEGAQIVPLGEDMPPCLIKKKDGTTLYATRDLAAAIYRQKTYGFTKSLYVVGAEQTVHFKQLFAVLEKMGYPWHKGMTHVPFGMMLKGNKKMSTRKGKVVLLEEVIKEAIMLAEENITEKNPDLANKKEVARQVGTGAVIFHDLKNYRMNDIEFSLTDMLRFEGETGPYVQYTHARASSLLKKGNFTHTPEPFVNGEDANWPLIKSLAAFPEVITHAFEKNDPSQVAKYVLELAKKFNKYYAEVRILADDPCKQSRLTLVATVKTVLEEGLRLLGIAAPEEM